MSRSENLCEKGKRENPSRVRVIWPTGATNTIYRFPSTTSHPSAEQQRRAELKSSGRRFLWSPTAQSTAPGCQALVFNEMTYLTEYTFSSAESTGHILAELCCHNYTPSVLFWFAFLYEGERPTGLRRGLTFHDEL